MGAARLSTVPCSRKEAQLKRVSAYVSAALALASIALVAFSAMTVYAKDVPVPSGRPGNPGHHYGEISNPGHHYGQLKHQPAPVPTPAPTPAPQPSSNPVTGPVIGILTSGHTAQPAATPAAAPPSSLPVPVSLPSQGRPVGDLRAGSPTSPDGLWWLVLLVLPALMAVWMIALGRLVQRIALGRRSNTAPAVLVDAPAA